MQHELEGTLARLAGSPLRRAGKLNLTADQLAQVLLHANKDEGVSPDSEAVRFYALNQLVSLITAKFTLNEPLPMWAAQVVHAYRQEMEDQHRRLLWYTFLVTTREFRHLPSGTSSPVFSKMNPKMKEFFPHIQDTTASSSLNFWLSKVPNIDLEAYCKDLTTQFDKGGYSSAFGGEAWGKVSRALQHYVGGQSSAETFIDTAYTLAHNGGPIFDKGMTYSHYTDQFLAMLDVQNSGQICEGLIEGKYTHLGTHHLLSMVQNVKEALGGIGEYIDWYRVESSGAKQSCSNQKATQDKKYGKKTMTLFEGKPIKITGQLDVPFVDAEGGVLSQTVEIYERQKVAA